VESAPSTYNRSKEIENTKSPASAGLFRFRGLGNDDSKWGTNREMTPWEVIDFARYSENIADCDRV
jgi:hypothetical protein